MRNSHRTELTTIHECGRHERIAFDVELVIVEYQFIPPSLESDGERAYEEIEAVFVLRVEDRNERIYDRRDQPAWVGDLWDAAAQLEINRQERFVS